MTDHEGVLPTPDPAVADLSDAQFQAELHQLGFRFDGKPREAKVSQRTRRKAEAFVRGLRSLADDL